MIALKDIKPGEILIIERPLIAVEDELKEGKPNFFQMFGKKDNELKDDMKKLYENST